VQNLRFVSSAVPEILGGSQNLKVGHVTQATPSCDLILYFWISTSWSPVMLQISTWLDLLFWRYCHCKVLAFWLENAIFGPIFSGFWGFWPDEIVPRLYILCFKRQTCDFLTLQTLVCKLQNLGSATGVGLLKFCARYWRVEATSEWQLVKHPADGHWPNYWTVTMAEDSYR